MKTTKVIFNLFAITSILILFAFGTLSNTKRVIVIDAGHGGTDFGAKTQDHFESFIVEKISKKIKALNTESDDFEIVLLREDDTFISLKDRVAKVNQIQPDLLISLHVNTSTNKLASGYETYVSKDNSFFDVSEEWANKITNHLTTTKLQSRPSKYAPLFILSKSNCAAVCLELGFLSNELDHNYLISNEGQDEIAEKIIEIFSE